VAPSTTDAVWVDVLPSMRGFATTMVKEATGAGRKAGQAAAKELTGATRHVGRDMAAAMTDGLEQAKAEVEKVSAALVAAKDKEADAAGKVRVAEEQLKAVRDKGTASAAQKAVAEERLATAQRKLEAAQRVTAGTTAHLDQAQAAAAARAKVLGEESDRAERVIVRLAASMERIDSSRIDTGAKTLARFGVSATSAASSAVALGSAAPAVAGLAAATAQAGGAALLLPGALLAGGVAVGVLKLGVSGLADAVKEWNDPEKFAEAIAELSPAGQAAAIAIRDLRPELIGLRNDVQQGLLAGAAEEIEELAAVYLPLLRTELPAVAASFGRARDGVAGFAASGQTVDDVRLILDQTQRAVDGVTAAAVPLVQVLRDVGVVGALVLGDMTGGWAEAAQGVAAFVADARATGQLEQWIRTGLDVLSQFGTLFSQVGGIINTVLGAARTEGGGLLDTLNQVTGSVLAMLQSAQGTQALAVLFSTVRQVVTALLPGLQAVAAAVFEGIIAVGPQLPAVAAGFSAAAVALAPLVVDLAQLAAVVLPPLAELITWLSPALPVLAAGFLAGSVALRGYNIVSSIIRWYQAWAAAQWALNAAMAANPIGLIVVAIAAVVAAIVWIATQTTWFQDLWKVVWGAISTAALWVWDNALKPAFDGIVAALRWVGDAAMWLWQNVFVPAWQGIAAAATWLWTTILQPVFDAISLAVRFLGAVIVTILVTPVVLAFRAFAAVATWLWTTVLSPVFSAIGAAATWLWTTILSPVVDSIVASVRAWAAIFSWLWTNAISPALSAIGTALSWLWTNIVQPVVNHIVATVRAWGLIFDWLWVNVIQPVGAAIGAAVAAVGEAFSWAWNNLIKPAWDALGAAISWVWENVIRPVFDAVKTAVGAVGSAFGAAVDFIQSAWDRVYDILSTPIKWIIDVVYNDGIRAVWNKVAGLVGLGELGPISFGGSSGSSGGRMLAMAGGGVLPGYAPGVDSVRALLSPGEAVLVPELVREIGPANILAANAAASGRPPGGGYSGGGVVQRFAGGGIVGSLLNWVSGIGDDIVRLWTDPVEFIKAQIGSTGWADLLARSPAKLIGDGASWLWGKVKEFFGFSSDAAAAAAGAAGGSPMGWQQMWNIIRAQFPAAILTSSFRPGDPGYHGKGRAIDIAGPMGAINSWIAKVYPNSTQLIYTPGVNLLNGAPFTYNAQTQADHHDHVHWAFDQGGYLPPGYSTVYNGTGRPEPVLTSEQWSTLGRSEGGQFTGELYLDSGEFLGRVRGEVRSELDLAGSAITRRRRP